MILIKLVLKCTSYQLIFPLCNGENKNRVLSKQYDK